MIFPYQKDVLLKTKMVRMVHVNIFYRMDLQICDSKNEFWTKTEPKYGGRKNEKIVWGPKWGF